MKNYIGKDFYKLFGISREASLDEIKSAYRKLAKIYHPDTNKGNKVSEEKFKELAEGYEILSDAKKRKQYDIANGFFKMNAGGQKASNQAKAQAKQAYGKEKQTVEGMPFSDILDGFWKKKEGTPQQNKSSVKKPQKGSDITLDVDLTPDEALSGTIKQINIMYINACSKCGGTGGKECVLCRGTNDVPKQEKVKVKIPAGVKTGTKVRIKNEGNRGRNGGVNGDLVLIVRVNKNEKFVYSGLDILYELPLTPSEAALGATISVPIPEGNLVIKIPSETSSGQKLKMAGEGLKDARGKKGDLVVTIKIQMPKGLSAREKELYKELSEQREFNPREKKNA